MKVGNMFNSEQVTKSSLHWHAYCKLTRLAPCCINCQQYENNLKQEVQRQQAFAFSVVSR